jgi:uncharacterized membrane protein YeiH
VPALAFDDWRYSVTAAAASLLVFWLHPQLARIRRTVHLLDAAGLGLFTAAGTLKALDFGVPVVGACILGMITGIGGGLLRDLLTGEIPLVLRREIYAVAALIGAIVVAAGAQVAAPSLTLLLVAATVTGVIRLIALRRNWSAPTPRESSASARTSTQGASASGLVVPGAAAPESRRPECGVPRVAASRTAGVAQPLRAAGARLNDLPHSEGVCLRPPVAVPSRVGLGSCGLVELGRVCGLAASRPSPATFPPLRAWQRRALVEYLRRRDEDYLAVATPGAGKTTFALRIAAELLADGSVEAVTVVTPTEHLKAQWAAAASAVGIQLDPAFRNADVHSSADCHGVVVTYAQVGMAPAVHRRRTWPEPPGHPGRDPPRAFPLVGRRRDRRSGRRAQPCSRAPFRSDGHPVRHLRALRWATRSVPTPRGYSDALADGVVRPVIFLAYSGGTRWRVGRRLSVRRANR